MSSRNSSSSSSHSSENQDTLSVEQNIMPIIKKPTEIQNQDQDSANTNQEKQNKDVKTSLDVPKQRKGARESKLVYIPTKNGKVAQIDFASLLAAKKRKESEKKEVEQKKPEPVKKKEIPKPAQKPEKVVVPQPKIVEQKIEIKEEPVKVTPPPVKKKLKQEPVENIYLGYDRNKLFEHIECIQQDLKGAKEQYNKDKQEEYENLTRLRQQEYLERLTLKSRQDIVSRKSFQVGIKTLHTGFSKPIYLSSPDNQDLKNKSEQSKSKINQNNKIKVIPWRPGGQKPKQIKDAKNEQQKQSHGTNTIYNTNVKRGSFKIRSLSPLYNKQPPKSEEHAQYADTNRKYVQQRYRSPQQQQQLFNKSQNQLMYSQISQYNNYEVSSKTSRNKWNPQISQDQKNSDQFLNIPYYQENQAQTTQNLDKRYLNTNFYDLTLENEVKSSERQEKTKKFDDFVENKYKNTLNTLKGYINQDDEMNQKDFGYSIQQQSSQEQNKKTKYLVLKKDTNNSNNQTKLPEVKYRSLSPARNTNDNYQVFNVYNNNKNLMNNNNNKYTTFQNMHYSIQK